MGTKESIGFKKIGIPSILAAFIALLSTPGISEFFDNTDTEALGAIKTAYPILVNEVEHLQKAIDIQRETNNLLYTEIKDLRATNRELSFLLIGKAITSSPARSGESSPEVLFTEDVILPEEPTVLESLKVQVQRKTPSKKALPSLTDILEM